MSTAVGYIGVVIAFLGAALMLWAGFDVLMGTGRIGSGTLPPSSRYKRSASGRAGEEQLLAIKAGFGCLIVGLVLMFVSGQTGA